MKLLLDTNVLLDMALNRNDNHKNADAVVKTCVQNINQGYITSHSITDFFYIVRKDCDFQTKMNWITFLVTTFTILTEDRHLFEECLKAEHFEDLEDQLQMESAAEANLDYVITENVKDFDNSKVQVITCKEFLEKK